MASQVFNNTQTIDSSNRRHKAFKTLYQDCLTTAGLRSHKLPLRDSFCMFCYAQLVLQLLYSKSCYGNRPGNLQCLMLLWVAPGDLMLPPQWPILSVKEPVFSYSRFLISYLCSLADAHYVSQSLFSHTVSEIYDGSSIYSWTTRQYRERNNQAFWF